MPTRVISFLGVCFRLLRSVPKDFIFSFLFTPFTPVAILPFDPQTDRIANKLIRRIAKVSPTVSVHFFGSSSLKIAGRGDIDLIVTCPPSAMPAIQARITANFGVPVRIEPTLIKWQFTQSSRSIEVVLTHPASREFIGQKRIFTLLKNDPAILRQYESTKLSFDHLSEWEYELRRKDFFNQVLISKL